MISLSKFVLFAVMCCVVWFLIWSWCLFDSYWKINFNQLQLQSRTLMSMLQTQRHEYLSHFDFIISSVGILPLYVINLIVVTLFANFWFAFIVMFNMWLCSIHSIKLKDQMSFFLSSFNSSEGFLWPICRNTQNSLLFSLHVRERNIQYLRSLIFNQI